MCTTTSEAVAGTIVAVVLSPDLLTRQTVRTAMEMRPADQQYLPQWRVSLLAFLLKFYLLWEADCANGVLTLRSEIG